MLCFSLSTTKHSGNPKKQFNTTVRTVTWVSFGYQTLICISDTQQVQKVVAYSVTSYLTSSDMLFISSYNDWFSCSNWKNKQKKSKSMIYDIQGSFNYVKCSSKNICKRLRIVCCWTM